MIRTTFNYPTIKETVNEMNKVRRSHPNSWLVFDVNVNGLNYKFKTYGTWTQRFESGDIVDGGAHALNVAGWKNEMMNFLSN